MRPINVRHIAARSIFHASVGMVLVIVLHFFPKPAALGFIAAVTAILVSIELLTLRFLRLRQRFLDRFTLLVRKEETSRLTGASYFMLGSLITAALFPAEIASLAIIYLSFGDPAASVVGRWRGYNRLWNKSVEGDLACLVACLLVGAVAISVLGKPPLLVGAAGAVFASLFQALPIRINDNITIPAGSGLAMFLISLILQ